MTTIVERHSDETASSAMTMIVALVALAVIVGLVLYLLRVYPFANLAPSDGNTVRVEVEGQLPAANLDGDNN